MIALSLVFGTGLICLMYISYRVGKFVGKRNKSVDNNK